MSLPARPLALSLALAAAALAGCRSTESHSIDDGYPPVEASELGSMHNVSVAGRVWFGGTPTPEDLDLAQRRGIDHVIDLCTTDERPGYDLAAVCRDLGLDLFQVPLASDESLTPPVVDQVLGELDRSEGPVLLFCGTGSRSATLVAIWRVTRQEVPLEQALVEARRAGMKPGAEDLVREQVARIEAG